MPIPDVDTRVDAAITKFENAGQIAHDYANLPDGNYIETEYGEIPSLATWMSGLGDGISLLPDRMNTIEESVAAANGQIDANTAELIRIAKVIGVTPEMYGYAPGASLATRNAAFQAMGVDAQAIRRPILIMGTYLISEWVAEEITELSMGGMGYIVGVDGAPHKAVVQIKNSTGIKQWGSVGVSANGNVNYESAMQVWGSGSGPSGLRTCSLHTLTFNALNAVKGYKFGDQTAPDNLLSEIVVVGAYTYNTPQPVEVIGSQAVIEFAGCQLVANGAGALSAYAHFGVVCHGGLVTITGGEVQMPAVTSGYGFVICPINSPGFAHSYGTIDCIGTKIEVASLHLIIYNPLAVPSPAAGTGGLSLSSGCGGYASFSGILYQESPTAGFSGKVVVDASCHFRAPVLRTAQTAYFYGNCKWKIDDLAFTNFKKGLGAVTGGIASFEDQQILEVANLNGKAANASTSFDLTFTAIPARDNNSRYASSYNTTTGEFTVPAGGLKSVRLQLCLALGGSARPNSEMNVLLNGTTLLGFIGCPSRYVNQTVECGDLAAGDKITIKYYAIAPDANFNFGSTNNDRLVIRARN